MSKFYAQLCEAESEGYIPVQTQKSVQARGVAKENQYKIRLAAIAEISEQFSEALAFAKAIIAAKEDTAGFAADEQVKMNDLLAKSMRLFVLGESMTDAMTAYLEFSIADKELAAMATDRIIAAMKEEGRE